MYQAHIPQYTIQNRNEHISVLNAVLWNMKQVHCGICEFGLSDNTSTTRPSLGIYLNQRWVLLDQFPPIL